MSRPFGSGDPAFFTTTDGEWFVPNGATRGPWDPAACHAGPPAGLMARAVEAAVPDQRLTRLCVDLMRPIPMAGFAVRAEVVRAGRSTSTTRVELTDADGRAGAVGHGLHVATVAIGDVPTSDVEGPDLDRMRPGPFPVRFRGHDQPAFNGPGVEVGYPEGETTDPGPTTIWMRTIPLLENETPSPFQRICPLADCGNAVSRNAEPWDIGFVNADVTIVLHRDPVGEWLASSAVSHWQPNGVGLADARLFDTEGPVGRACQTLIVRPSRTDG